MKQLILINLSGVDKPGLTATISGVLARHQFNILDIGQSEVLGLLSLSLLAEADESADITSVKKDVLYHAHELEFGCQFQLVDSDVYESWARDHGKGRYIVTLLARKISASQLQAVTQAIAEHGLNIDNITRLSGRLELNESEESETTSSPSSKVCIELSVRGQLDDQSSIRAQFLSISGEQGIDIAFQEDNIFRRNRRLVAFDMDSTLIEAEVIDELAKCAGVGDEVSAITEQAMMGEIDFSESFRRRVALLKGLDASVLEDIAKNLPITEGAEVLMANLRAIGYKTAILSGGFSYFGQYLQERLGIDYVYSNELEVVDGKVTGRVTGQIVDGKRKAELLKQIAHEEGIRLEQVIAVGDGANDLPMLNIAGLGIAFRAKPVVKKSARQALSTVGLDGVMYLLGFRDHNQKFL